MGKHSISFSTQHNGMQNCHITERVTVRKLTFVPVCVCNRQAAGRVSEFLSFADNEIVACEYFFDGSQPICLPYILLRQYIIALTCMERTNLE